METTTKKKSELRSLYHHWFPNEKTKGLLLDIQKSVPKELMDIKFLQPIISNYNPYLKYYIKDLLSLVEPSLPNVVTTNICHLAELISSPDKYPIGSSKIYTVDDVSGKDGLVLYDQNDKTDMEVDQPMDIDMNANAMKQCTAHSGIWELSSLAGWSTCPIGLVPSQLKCD